MSVKIQISLDLGQSLPPNTIEYWDYPWNGHFIQHDWNCPNRKLSDSKELSSECSLYDCHIRGPAYIQTTYQGCVLETRERNYYDDSDFYALVWDESTQSIKEIEYGTTRAWTYFNSAKEDASPEILTKAFAYRYESLLKISDFCEQSDMSKLQIGRHVKVIKGRKVPIGTEGFICQIYNNLYDKLNQKIKLQTETTHVFTYERNLEFLDSSKFSWSQEKKFNWVYRMSNSSTSWVCNYIPSLIYM